MSPVTVSVDSRGCQGHALCALAAPALFDIDDDGHSVVMVDAVPADQLKAAGLAVSACPERAVTLHQ